MSSRRIARPRRATFAVAASLALAFVTGVSVDAASQTKAPAAAKGATAPKGAAPKAAAKPTKQPAAPKAAKAAKGPSSTQATSSSEVQTGWAGDAGAATAMPVPTYTPPPSRKTFPPPSPPTDEQVRALEQMQAESSPYEQAARDYRDTITRIVQHHYEEKRRRVLAALDGEIQAETSSLKDARAEAIKRLEEFVARYTGANAHPESTPDAMFRLAALYEETVRADSPEGDALAQGLKPAVALYKRVIREFPNYRELAGIYYYLGHALNDSSRLDEAQQVWRSLVCHNKFPYPAPTDPKNPDKDALVAMPQDHDDAFWQAWEIAHPPPLPGGAKAKVPTRVAKAKKAPAKAGKGAKAEPVEIAVDPTGESSYANPYPDECAPIPQKIEAGADPRYVAEIWWQIGNYHFDQLDARGGPYNLNRAVTAYQQSMKFKKPPLYGVAMYKLAWTYFKQQRYEAAVREFVNLLQYSDEQEKLTGDPGTDFRSEAYTYIAGSLTYVDFAGPTSDEPYLVRSDVLDTETNPALAEQKMHQAIERVQDAKLIPQDQKWAVEIYRALANEYREVNQWRNAIEVNELILKKWPMFRDAPQVQSQIADIFDELTRLSRDGSPEKDQNAARGLEARTRLAAYVGNTPWVDANRDDPEAIQNAERLVKGGLRRAAADHTNLARAFVGKATEAREAGEQRTMLEKALAEYRLADIGWSGFLAQQEEGSPDGYETRFWIADARRGAIVVEVALERSPTQAEIFGARQAAVDVRDSNENDKFLEPSAFYVVDVAEQSLNDAYRQFEKSGGTAGIENRKEVKFQKDEAGNDKVVAEPLPPNVQAAVVARDEYLQRVAPAIDVNKRSPFYTFQAADYFFLYGQWDEAAKRFEPIWKDQCAKSEWGYKAWDRLNTIAARTNDAERLRTLQASQQCAVTDEQKQAEGETRKTVGTGLAYVDAYKAYKAAEGMADGPERKKAWLKAAALYEEALQKGPDAETAPEAAMNGAYAYKQVGEYDKAIAMYELFIAKYGDEKTLAKLETDKSAKYAERVKYLQGAYDTLSKSYVLFFNYKKAAETYDKISQTARFPEKDRRDAARNALVLYSNMGDETRMSAMRERLDKLGPSPQEKAEADFVYASADFKNWDARGADEGKNRDFRQRASAALTRFTLTNRGNNAAAKFMVEAAYDLAIMKRASGEKGLDDAWHATIDAYDRYKAVAPTRDGKSEAEGSREAGFAAEAEYTLVDAQIKRDFDYDTGHHRYAGDVVTVTDKYKVDAAEAKKLVDGQLKHVISYASPDWAVAAYARMGSIYDSLRTGLYNTREPALKLFTDKEDKLLKRLESSDDPDAQDKADQFRQARRDLWRTKRESELGVADENMVYLYGTSISLAKRYNVRNPAVNRALSRLAFFTDILGEEKMRQYTQSVDGLGYRDGMFLQTRPGLPPPTSPDPVAPPFAGAP